MIKLSSILYTIILTLLFSAFLSAGDIQVSMEEQQKIEQGDVVVREIKTNSKVARTFEVIGVMAAPKDVICSVLTDYEKYPDFLPNISKVEVLENQDNVSTLNYTLSLPLNNIKKYRLVVTVTEPDAMSCTINWHLIEWPGLKTAETIKDTTGYWKIEQQDDSTSLVLYHVFTDPGPIPFGLGWIINMLTENSIPDAFQSTRSRSEGVVSQLQ